MTTRTKPATPAPTPDAPGMAALERGETLPATWYTDPSFYAREQEGTLRGYVNVCRHRGSQLVNAEQGNRTTLQCAYHAWTYDLDGSLRAAPGMRDDPEFDKACYALVPVQVDAWGPFIFANPDRDAPPLASVLGELP